MEDKCGLFNRSSNETYFPGIDNPYAGIPQNLLINVIGFAALVSVFLILRLAAWSRVAKALLPGNVLKWRRLFFTPVRDPGRVPGSDRQPAASYDATECIYPESGSNGPQPDESRVPRRYSVGHWLRLVFTASDNDLERTSGIDAVHYLRLQRHIMLYLALVTVISVAVILPINFSGNVRGDTTTFDHTTLVNLEPDSKLLWVHVVMAMLMFPLATIIMRNFSIRLKFPDTALEMNLTLMVDGVPRRMCHSEDMIRRHFSEAYPDVNVSQVSFAYNVKELLSAHYSLEKAILALDFSQKQPSTSIYPAACSRCSPCICCCFVSKMDATDYYRHQVSMLSQQVAEERQAALGDPLGIVFVSFQTVNMAKEVYDSFQRPWLKCFINPPLSSVAEQLRIRRWNVTFARLPQDIYWENLSTSRRFLTLKKLLSNVFVLVLALFLTTPEYMVSQSNSVLSRYLTPLNLPSWMVDFLPTLLLWAFTALLPFLVTYSDRWLGHWYRSTENHSIMKKCFFFFIFMVIVLPTFGLTTAQATLQFLFLPTKNETYLWECVFLPDSGAFFVNYVITAALIGVGLELIRLPDQIWYVLQVCLSRSKLELPAIQKAVKYEFRFGEQYARTLLLLNMTLAFSFSCPLITPFGLLYFILKHYVDRHNLMFVYLPCKMNKRVHLTAINYVMMSTIMLQFFITVFTVLRSGTFFNLMSQVSIGVLLFCTLIYAMTFWSRTLAKLGSVRFLTNTIIRDGDQSVLGGAYLPDILKEAVLPPTPPPSSGSLMTKESEEIL